MRLIQRGKEGRKKLQINEVELLLDIIGLMKNMKGGNKNQQKSLQLISEKTLSLAEKRDQHQRDYMKQEQLNEIVS